MSRDDSALNTTPPETAASHLGAAIDIGTSTLRAAVVDLRSARVLATRAVPNPHNAVGYDVVTRVQYALRGERAAAALRDSLRGATVGLVTGMVRRLGLSRDRVREMVVVGNTVMHHLFLGLSVDGLAEHPYTPESRGPVDVSGDALALDLPACTCHVPPVVDAFVGPDALASLIASRGHCAGGTCLVMDVGVNTELVLVDGDHTWMTSAPSGPAFEGMSIECGMPAVPGAVFSVRVQEGGRVAVRTLGRVPPRGLCGSGAVSAVAEALRAGLLTREGSIRRDTVHPLIVRGPGPSVSICLVRPHGAAPSRTSRGVYLSQQDIRMLQLSKAAVRAALDTLVATAGTGSSDIDRVVLTGAFGHSMDVRDLVDIGVLPARLAPRVVQGRDCALRGAIMLLLDRDLRSVASSLASRTRYVDLEASQSFDQRLSAARLFDVST